MSEGKPKPVSKRLTGFGFFGRKTAHTRYAEGARARCGRKTDHNGHASKLAEKINF